MGEGGSGNKRTGIPSRGGGGRVVPLIFLLTVGGWRVGVFCVDVYVVSNLVFDT